MAKQGDDLGTIAHILVIVSGFVGPLIIYLVRGKEFPNTHENARHALNFAITITIASIVSGVLMLVLIGFVLIFAVIALQFIFPIIGAVKASKGEIYKYPIAIEFIKQ